ncbi:unnamed protein product [Protopolystoma xenopodis]|uniref:Uncharacterized protein n=1 Tax=Protopolystoma xenopodis TaxID=117903 RepID=A0A448WK51_9PLAT|nr:unnamed protein product [Protopolystoma xenopodis]
MSNVRLIKSSDQKTIIHQASHQSRQRISHQTGSKSQWLILDSANLTAVQSGIRSAVKSSLRLLIVFHYAAWMIDESKQGDIYPHFFVNIIA